MLNVAFIGIHPQCGRINFQISSELLHLLYLYSALGTL